MTARTNPKPDGSNPNAHVKEAICAYWSEPKDRLSYHALLVHGAWGVGKTHLVRNAVKEIREEKNAEAVNKSSKIQDLYISLNGITKTEEILGSLFSQIIKAKHPKLSTAMGLLQNAGAGLAGMATFASGLGNTGQSIIQKTSSPIGEILAEALCDKNDLLIILDDLERCNIPMRELLGYINHLIQNESYKIIIISNTDKIEEDEKPIFKQISEKVIGERILVRADRKGVLEWIFNHNLFQDQHKKTIIQENATKFTSAIEDPNFRTLKYCLNDANRLINIIDKEHVNKEKEIADLLLRFLFLKYYSCIGVLSRDWDKQTEQEFILPQAQEKSGQETAIKKIIDQHRNHFKSYLTIVPKEVWDRLLFEGDFQPSKINQALSESSYFKSHEDEPTWVTVVRGYEKDEQTFNMAADKLLQDIKGNKIEEYEILMHAASISVWIVAEVYPECGEWTKVRDNWNAYFETLFSKDKVDLIEDERNFFSNASRFGFHGFGIMSKNDEKYKEILNEFKRQYAQYKSDKLISIAQEILNYIDSQAYRFYQSLTPTNAECRSYYNTPLLHHIDEDEFVEKIKKISPLQQHLALSIFKDRYIPNMLEELKDEKDWCRNVLDKLEEYSKSKFGIHTAQIRNNLEMFGNPARCAWDEFDKRAHKS